VIDDTALLNCSAFSQQLRHVDQLNRVWLVFPNIFTFRHPAPPVRFLWTTLTNSQHLDYVHQVWAASYAVGCMAECSMKVVIQLGLHCSLTTPSMNCMTSLTSIFWVNLATDLDVAVLLDRNWQGDIKFVCPLLIRFGVYNISMANMTLASVSNGSVFGPFVLEQF